MGKRRVRRTFTSSRNDVDGQITRRSLSVSEGEESRSGRAKQERCGISGYESGSGNDGVAQSHAELRRSGSALTRRAQNEGGQTCIADTKPERFRSGSGRRPFIKRSRSTPTGDAMRRLRSSGRSSRALSLRSRPCWRSHSCTRSSGRDVTAGQAGRDAALLRPAGSGKTRSVEAAAEILFGDPNA